MNRSRIITLLAAALLAVAALFGLNPGGAPDAGRSGEAASSALAPASRADARPVIALSELPAEAKRVIELIRSDGPFPYDKDGTPFGNREKLLPPRDRGYYREYTVPTPGAQNRGARRIVAGGPRTRPSEMYYTQDHYASFRLIEEDVR